MNFLWLALMASALCAMANLLDRGLVSGDDEESSIPTLTAIGGFFNLLMAVLIGVWVIPNYGIDLAVFGPLFFNGVIYVIAIWLYFKCLKTEETSRVIPFYQIIPIFGIVVANLIIGELPTSQQLAGIITLVIGGTVLSLKKGVITGKLAMLMILSSALVAVNDVIFGEFGRGHATSETIFADWCGKAFFGLLALFWPSVRRSFVPSIRAKMGTLAGSEIAFSSGDGLMDAAKLVMPIAVAQAAFCTQPLFVLIGVLLFMRRFPKLKEDFSRKEMVFKAIGIVVMVVGGILLTV
jgi:drug/metabolite transporter (DMT)-like permease